MYFYSKHWKLMVFTVLIYTYLSAPQERFEPEDPTPFRDQLSKDQSILQPIKIPYLDTTHCLLGLHHSDVFGRVALRQQLCGAQVIGCKDDSINEVLRFTRSWNWQETFTVTASQRSGEMRNWIRNIETWTTFLLLGLCSPSSLFSCYALHPAWLDQQ